MSDRRDLVCFESSFRRENASNITHATFDGERTLCGRTGWVTSEGWIDSIEPDCLRCARAIKNRKAVNG